MAMLPHVVDRCLVSRAIARIRLPRHPSHRIALGRPVGLKERVGLRTESLLDVPWGSKTPLPSHRIALERPLGLKNGLAN